jgi:hypothetical protein
MRPLQTISIGAALLLLPLALGAARAEAQEGVMTPAQWLARANEALLAGESLRARARIVTRDRFGGEWVDEFVLIRASYDGATRTLIEVVAPEVGKGTAYEIVARPGEPVERWVWLPSLRRLRKVIGVRRTDPFLGTEFSYEDLGLVLPAERADDRVRRVTQVGEGADRVLEIQSPPYHYYQRVVTRIDPDTYLPVRVDFYDRAGQLFRQQRFEGVETVEGMPFPMRITMEDLITGTRSVLEFESIEPGVEIPESRFAESVIRRGIAARERSELGESPPPPGTLDSSGRPAKQ